MKGIKPYATQSLENRLGLELYIHDDNANRDIFKYQYFQDNNFFMELYTYQHYNVNLNVTNAAPPSLILKTRYKLDYVNKKLVKIDIYRLDKNGNTEYEEHHTDIKDPYTLNEVLKAYSDYSKSHSPQDNEYLTNNHTTSNNTSLHSTDNAVKSNKPTPTDGYVSNDLIIHTNKNGGQPNKVELERNHNIVELKFDHIGYGNNGEVVEYNYKYSCIEGNEFITTYYTLTTDYNVDFKMTYKFNIDNPSIVYMDTLGWDKDGNINYENNNHCVTTKATLEELAKSYHEYLNNHQQHNNPLSTENNLTVSALHNESMHSGDNDKQVTTYDDSAIDINEILYPKAPPPISGHIVGSAPVIDDIPNVNENNQTEVIADNIAKRTINITREGYPTIKAELYKSHPNYDEYRYEHNEGKNKITEIFNIDQHDQIVSKVVAKSYMSTYLPNTISVDCESYTYEHNYPVLVASRNYDVYVNQFRNFDFNQHFNNTISNNIAHTYSTNNHYDSNDYYGSNNNRYQQATNTNRQGTYDNTDGSITAIVDYLAAVGYNGSYIDVLNNYVDTGYLVLAQGNYAHGNNHGSYYNHYTQANTNQHDYNVTGDSYMIDVVF